MNLPSNPPGFCLNELKRLRIESGKRLDARSSSCCSIMLLDDLSINKYAGPAAAGLAAGFV